MKTYIVGNWKLNFTVGESSIYLHKIQKSLPIHKNLEVIIAPSVLALQPLSLQIDRKNLKLAAQNAFYRDFGAYSGEISFPQLRGVADYCLIGQPERRYLFHESDRDIRQKVSAALRNKITPIIYLSETESDRAFGETHELLRDQLLTALADVDAEDLEKVILAYDPLWAMSNSISSRYATPDEVAETVAFLRKILAETYNKSISEKIPILFGGHVSPSNVGGYLTIPGINGVSFGASSLILSEFIGIIETAKKVQS